MLGHPSPRIKWLAVPPIGTTIIITTTTDITYTIIQLVKDPARVLSSSLIITTIITPTTITIEVTSTDERDFYWQRKVRPVNLSLQLARI